MADFDAFARSSGAQGVPPTSSPLSAAEVGELWEFIHGDIMVGGIRAGLRDALGLCPRHAWGYAIVEIELWVYGTGPRGGHQPFDVCVLYGDLLDHVVARLRRRRSTVASLPRTLERRGACWICRQLSGQDGKPVRRSFAGADATVLADEANQMRYTTAWCVQTREVWEGRVCPSCRSGSDLTDREGTKGPGSGAVNCLGHLVSMQFPAAAGTLAELVDYLESTAARLDALGRTMRQGAAPPTPNEDGSWIETLGWFAGWDVPLSLIARSAQ